MSEASMDRRADVVAIYRVRNEARWIRASLERTFEVAKTVVLFDDGSSDLTLHEACTTAEPDVGKMYTACCIDGSPVVYHSADEERLLHIIRSPFRPAETRPEMAVNEVRDKNLLWEYCKANVPFRHVLCLDGDEILSRRFVRDFGKVLAAFEDKVDVATVPFVYLWDGDGQARVDGCYGRLPDGHARLRFSRMFTIDRVPAAQLQRMRFEWKDAAGGFHCGSVPMAGFRVAGPNGTLRDPVPGFYSCPVVHLGYRDAEERERKYRWYNALDPNNDFEGRYLHCIGQPDIHAPGPVVLEPWIDQ